VLTYLYWIEAVYIYAFVQFGLTRLRGLSVFVIHRQTDRQTDR